MDEIIRELQHLDIEDDEALILFLKKFQKEMTLISVQDFSSSKFAENLMTVFFQIAKRGGLGDPNALSTKAISIYDRLPEDCQKGALGAKLDQLCTCLITFARQHISDIAKDLMAYRIMHMINAKGDSKTLKAKSIELTALLEGNFDPLDDPQALISSLLKQSPKHRDYLVVTIANLNKTVFALLKLQKKHLQDAACIPGIDFMITLLQARVAELQENLLKQRASQIIEDMKKNCIDCKIHLNKKIAAALNHNSKWQSQFGRDVEAFIHAYLIADKNTIAYADIFGSMSKDLKIAVDCYQATNILHAVIDNEYIINPVHRLRDAKNFYLQPETQNTFKSNPDWKVVQFFKKIGYLFGKLFTFGYGNFFMLPQEKLNKFTNDLFETASKKGVLTMAPTIN